MKRKLFKVGDKIEGKTSKGNVVVGVICKVNKTTYKLESGALIKFADASEVNMEHWESIIDNRMKTAMQRAIQAVDYANMQQSKIKNAFIALFGENHYNLILNSIKKQLGL